jgi:hypothetical protein
MNLDIDIERLLKLRLLIARFGLGLLRDEKGKTVFRVESGPLSEVMSRIEERASYGDTASGRLLADELAKEPFGWDFEAVEGAIGQMKAILRGSEDNAIATFNASHRSIKEAIKRGSELENALTEPRLRDLERARQAMTIAWPFLEAEPDLSDDVRSRAATLTDVFSRETFFRDLPAIEQHAGALEAEYARRFGDALQARVDAYTKAFQRLIKTPGWGDLDEAVQRSIAEPFQRGMSRVAPPLSIPLLRSERDACESRLRAAIAEVRRIIDGERLATVNLGSYFGGGIETEEQLDAALEGIREECARLIGAGKKVVLS